VALASFTMEKAGGPRVTFTQDVGDLLAAQIGAQWTFRWNGGDHTVRITDAFRMRLTRALDTGEVITLGGVQATTRRLINLRIGQSNEEGRAPWDKAPRIVNAQRIGPLGPPWDKSQSGPGLNAVGCLGPLLLDKILSRIGNPWQRATQISTATGSQTIDDLLGPGGLGLDGNYRTQLNNEAVCGGPEGSNPPPFIQPGDDFFITFTHGESDSNTPSPPDYAAKALILLARAVADFPSSNCLGILIFRLPPSLPDNAPRDWAFMRAQQLLLHDPTATPKRIVIDLIDADRQPDDKIHLDMGEDDSRGLRRIAVATLDEMIRYGMVA
jgi:hypothetical protein